MFEINSLSWFSMMAASVMSQLLEIHESEKTPQSDHTIRV